jgi:hypothetical protein
MKSTTLTTVAAPLYDTPTGLELWLAYAQSGKLLARVEETVTGDSVRCRVDAGFGQALWDLQIALEIPGSTELPRYPTDPGVLEALKALCPAGTALAIRPLRHPRLSTGPTPCAVTFIRPDALWPERAVAAGWENQVVRLFGDYCRKLTRNAWTDSAMCRGQNTLEPLGVLPVEC